MRVESWWRKNGLEARRVLGFQKNPAKYIYFRANRYEVNIKQNGVLKYIGRFKTLQEAIQRRDQQLNLGI